MVNQELKSPFSKQSGAVLHSPEKAQRFQLNQDNASVCFRMHRRLISPAAGQLGLWVLLGTCEGERLEEGLELRKTCTLSTYLVSLFLGGREYLPHPQARYSCLEGGSGSILIADWGLLSRLLLLLQQSTPCRAEFRAKPPTPRGYLFPYRTRIQRKKVPAPDTQSRATGSITLPHICSFVSIRDTDDPWIQLWMRATEWQVARPPSCDTSSPSCFWALSTVSPSTF